jgi:hypothetical protein
MRGSAMLCCLALAWTVPTQATAQQAPGGTVPPRAGPASVRPIMPPGAPPLPVSAAQDSPSEKTEADESAAMLRAVQERLAGLRVTVILDGAAVLRAGSALSPNAQGASSVHPGVVTVRHGKAFSLADECALMPVVSARSVALYWMDGLKGTMATRSDGPPAGRLVFYREIEPGSNAPR